MLPLPFVHAARPGKPWCLAVLAVLFLVVLLSCSHSMDNAEDPPTGAVAGKTEKAIKQSWSGDYPVDQLALLAEGADQRGSGYIGDAPTFRAVWSAFKPGEHVPDVDFNVHLVIFVRNTQYYNHMRIGRVMLENGVASVMAMETLSARPIEDVVALSMAVISREGVTGIQLRDGVIEVEGKR
jgi:hypothetical protein